MVGPQGRSGRAENLVPTGIRSRTVQSVVILTELPGQQNVKVVMHFHPRINLIMWEFYVSVPTLHLGMVLKHKRTFTTFSTNDNTLQNVCRNSPFWFYGALQCTHCTVGMKSLLQEH